ncbi:MAG TPA: hypothetical protein VMV71_00405 [Candidatus Paceibacterota bacterium]|nr:hypothetical protein [Candidatus Paceibacterota bacterium]
MPLYTLEWEKGRRPEGSDKEVFIAKSDEHAFVHAAAATCITMEDGKPNLRDFLAAGALELRKGNAVIFPLQNARPQSGKPPHIALVYAASKAKQ